MDCQQIKYKMSICFADKKAKEMLIIKHSREHEESILNTPWPDLCDGKIPQVKVTEIEEKCYKEMYQKMDGILADILPKVFPKITLEDLPEDERILFSDIPVPFSHNKEWADKYRDERNLILRFFLDAKSRKDEDLCNYLLLQMKKLRNSNPK